MRAWTLTPAEIAAAAAARSAGPQAVTAVTHRRLGAVSSTLMTAVRLPYGWDDLVVADTVLDQLQGTRVPGSAAGEVLDDWGFRRLSPRAGGTTALFAGPSGTGKTMAAQVLARSLELDLYRVDLAEVVNKYIGETEKRLAPGVRRMRALQRDASSSTRPTRCSASGRGCATRTTASRTSRSTTCCSGMEQLRRRRVLATNRKGDLDPAFLRRLRVIVDFIAPTPGRAAAAVAARAAAERRPTRPTRSPRARPRAGSPQSLTMTGAEIKSAALGGGVHAPERAAS